MEEKPFAKVKMEENPYSFASKRYKPSIDDATNVLRSVRDTWPAHYIFKIESFSSLKNAVQNCGCGNIELTNFPAGGYTWVMSIYPNGNSKDNGSGHLSFYLKLVDNLDGGSTVVVTSRFFIYDQIRDNYLTIQDVRDRHFHAAKIEWGIAKVISAGAFSEPSNGYLINDSCVFGAEVFVLNCKSKVAKFYVVKRPRNSMYTWKVKKFSHLKDSTYSPDFDIKGHSWKLCLVPKGQGDAKGRSLSLFLHANSSEFTSGGKLYAAYELRVKNLCKDKDRKSYGESWFSQTEYSWGYASFLPLSDLECRSKGFKVNDVIIIEVRIDEVLVLKDT